MRVPLTLAGRYRIHRLQWWTKRVTPQEIAIVNLFSGNLVWVWHNRHDDSGEILLGLEITHWYAELGGRWTTREAFVPGLACSEGWPMELLALFRGSAQASTDMWLVVGTTGIANIEGLQLTGVER